SSPSLEDAWAKRQERNTGDVAGRGAVDGVAPRRPVGPQHGRHRRLVLVPQIDRAAELEVPQQEALLPGVERLEVDERLKILAAVEWPEGVSLRVEGAQGIFDPLVEQVAVGHHAEAAVGLVVDGPEGP